MTKLRKDSGGFTVRCTVTDGTTVLAVRGRVGSSQCDTLRDALEMARMIRPGGPIVVDLGGARQLAPAALAMLYHAADDAHKGQRPVTVRNLRADAVVPA